MATVTIDRAYFDTLLSSARQYANLRRNLFRGGIAEETLAVLIKDDTPEQEDVSVTVERQPRNNGGAAKTTTTESKITNGGGFAFGRNVVQQTQHENHRLQPRNEIRRSSSNLNNDYDFVPEGPVVEYDAVEFHDNFNNYQRPMYEKHAQRTLQLVGIPDSATHEDIVKVVRGGPLLDVYLRPNDRIVHISFLEEADAQDFFRHVKRHDLYIKGKRVEIRWNDRQFILPGHVAREIFKGATRNFIIQNCGPRHTDESIRDDLEHIHNLVVIKITFKDQRAFVSTNSVHNAMFARTCMMSRTSYRSTKILWDDDECSAPLEKPLQLRQENIAPKKQPTPVLNRFELLNMDGTDDGSVDDESTDMENFKYKSTISSKAAGILACEH